MYDMTTFECEESDLWTLLKKPLKFDQNRRPPLQNCSTLSILTHYITTVLSDSRLGFVFRGQAEAVRQVLWAQALCVEFGVNTPCDVPWHGA